MNMPIILYINTKLLHTNQKKSKIWSDKDGFYLLFFQSIFAHEYRSHICPDQCKVRAIFRSETFVMVKSYHG